MHSEHHKTVRRAMELELNDEKTKTRVNLDWQR